MPRLVLFGVCQKAIWDAEENSASLISLISGVYVSPSDVKRALNEENQGGNQLMIAPLRWAAVSVWRSEEGDAGKTFEQRIEIVDPLSRIAGGGVVPFVLEPPASVNTVRVNGDAVPIGAPGQLLFKLFLREVVEGSDWRVMAEYPVDINHAQE
jgi:hypothetical protein